MDNKRAIDFNIGLEVGDEFTFMKMGNYIITGIVLSVDNDARVITFKVKEVKFNAPNPITVDRVDNS